MAKHILTNEGYSVAVFGNFPPRYVRTDRNGTKIYHDINCPRCGGAGESDNWWLTGRTCFACGGTGKRAKPLAVKVYTQEYWERLEDRRAAKAAAEAPSAEELQQREAEAQRLAEEARRIRWQCDGFNRDGVAYVYQGDTYKHREAFRKAGAHWAYRRWFSPVPVECGIEPTIVSAKGSSSGDLCWDAIEDYNLPKW